MAYIKTVMVLLCILFIFKLHIYEGTMTYARIKGSWMIFTDMM